MGYDRVDNFQQMYFDRVSKLSHGTEPISIKFGKYFENACMG